MSHLEGLWSYVAHSGSKMKQYYQPPGFVATALFHESAVDSFSISTSMIPSWALKVCDDQYAPYSPTREDIDLHQPCLLNREDIRNAF
jgi:hypothetical protein